MSTPSEAIRQLLLEYQTRNRLTDRDMAQRLGMHFSYWSRVKPRQDIPPKLLAGFARIFPRRMGLVRALLLGSQADEERNHDT